MAIYPKKKKKKVLGYSLVELGNHVYEFVMGDRFHPQGEEIYAMLAEITKRLKIGRLCSPYSKCAS